MDVDDLPSASAPTTLLGAGGTVVSPQAASHALDTCPNGVLIVDGALDGAPVIYANLAACRMFGRDSASLIGYSALLLNDESGDRPLGALVAAALDQPGEQRALVASPGAAPVWHAMLVSPVAGCRQLVCIVDDVSELQQHKARLAYLCTHDALTGLAQRSLFNERLQQAITHAAPGNATVAVLCVSLDSFSLVNESLGHAAGDQLVLGAAERLKASLGPHDMLSRHASNEFVLILAAAGAEEQLDRTCRRLIAALAEPLAIANQHLHATSSIGIARYPQDGTDGATLLRFAEMALSQARKPDANNVVYFTSEMGRRTAERIEMEAALRLALAQDELQLRYQPMADLQDGTLCALEALLRWQHPEQGLIDARRFISVAEEAGLTTALGHWALRRACHDMRAWRDAGVAPARVAVNISPKQFRERGLVQAVSDALQEAGIDASLLVLEVTEEALMKDPVASAATLQALKTLGVGLTLDDFGSGYFSLNHLKRFPLDLVKIDCNLIGSITSGTDEAVLVKTIISMAHHLGMKVAAVGVEDEAQCDFLRRNMCDQIQGYFFAPPADLAQINGLLAARHTLPPHLLRIQKQKRTLLLVDDEQNIVSALKRLLRRDDYQILSAHSGAEGLEVLAANAVDVIVSDQRMPGMIGADFLRAAKLLYPKTLRIMLSGYTELQSVTDAVNEGAIYKFLTKPWDDEQLRGHIAEAFRLKEIADENERLNLELRTANHELATANRRMEELLLQKQLQIKDNEISLTLARELLQFIPLAVIGLDDDGMVAFINRAAETVFAQSGAILGNEAAMVLPELFPDGMAPTGTITARIGARCYQAVAHPMGAASRSRGVLITLSPCEEPA